MRFNGILLGLMALAAISALAMPPTTGDSFRKVGILFMPISSPVRQIAGSVDARMVKPIPTTSSEASAGRTAAQLRDDNETLKYQVSSLSADNERLTLLNESLLVKLNSIGTLNSKIAVRLVPVIGGDLGSQQVLTLQLLSGEGVASNTPVMYPPKNFAGKLEVVGLGAARVRLISDKNSTVTGMFRRYKADMVLINMPQPIKTMEGLGNGKMVIKSVKRDEAFPPNHPENSLAIGDWFVVKDKDLPDEVQGYKLGEIESIADSKQPQFVTIVLRPATDLMKLREVMVQVRK